ncbi:MAG: hypothetical protein LKF69_00280 [Bacilli bacterium]|nr:hypothetical protein [Bacilli bacterium]MCH4235224.1 hypothetical protein [Bacilli bacterium]
MNKDKIKKEFQGSQINLFYIDEFIKQNSKMIKQNGIDEATLISWQHETRDKDNQSTQSLVNGKEKPIKDIIA